MQIESSDTRYNRGSEIDNSTLSQTNLFPVDRGSFESFISATRGSQTQEVNRALSNYFDSTNAFELCDGNRIAPSRSARTSKELADTVVQLSDTQKSPSPTDGRNTDSSKGPVDETKMAIGVGKAESDRKGTVKDAGAKQQDGNDWKGKLKDEGLAAAEFQDQERLKELQVEAKRFAENIQKDGLDFPITEFARLQKIWGQAKKLPGDTNKTMADTMKAAFKEVGMDDVRVSVLDSSSKDAPKIPWNKHCDSIMLLERNSGTVKGIYPALGGLASESVRHILHPMIKRPAK